MTKSYIVAGEGKRCFTCGTKCYEDALILHDERDKDNKDDVYFCGNCVYHNTAIGRPCNSWISKLEQDKEEKRRKRVEAKAKREHEKWLAKFCCRKWGEFIHHMYGFNNLTIYGNGAVFFTDYYEEDMRDSDNTDKFNFDYCPYCCSKEFIRQKK